MRFIIARYDDANAASASAEVDPTNAWVLIATLPIDGSCPAASSAWR
jgi:hypothetical protein